MQVLQDTVRYFLFWWMEAAVSGLQGSVKEHLRWTVDSWFLYSTPLLSDNTINSTSSAFQEHASQIKGQVTKDFCCMKEYVERQERNTLMFIEQEQKAAEEKTEETIHQLCVDMNNLLDIKAETVRDEVVEYQRKLSGWASWVAEHIQRNFRFSLVPVHRHCCCQGKFGIRNSEVGKVFKKALGLQLGTRLIPKMSVNRIEVHCLNPVLSQI